MILSVEQEVFQVDNVVKAWFWRQLDQPRVSKATIHRTMISATSLVNRSQHLHIVSDSGSVIFPGVWVLQGEGDAQPPWPQIVNDVAVGLYGEYSMRH